MTSRTRDRLRGRQPARPRSSPDQHGRRGRRLDERARGRGRALPAASAPRGRRPAARRLRRARARRWPGGASTGSATIPAVAGRSARRRRAGGSRRAPRRRRRRPRRSGAAALRSLARTRRRARAPPSRARRRRTGRTPARARRPARPTAARRRTAPDRARPTAPSPSRGSGTSTSSSSTPPAWRAGRRRAPARATRTPPPGSRRRRAISSRRRSASADVAAASSAAVDERRDDQLAWRPAAASGSARRTSASTPSSPRGAISSERDGLRRRRAGAARAPRSSAGSWRRIACSSCLQLLARLEPELVGELALRLAVGAERLGLPAGAIEREHQLAAQPLAQRMLGDERVELADQLRVPARGEIGVDPLLERRPAQLLEPRDLGLRERLVGEVGERRAAPQRQRPPQRRGGAVGIGALRLADELLEAREVELRPVDLQGVAGRRGSRAGRRRAPCAAARRRPARSWPAVGGGAAPHSASISRSVETTSFACSSSIANRDALVARRRARPRDRRRAPPAGPAARNASGRTVSPARSGAGARHGRRRRPRGCCAMLVGPAG